jgi:hypothetical protein
VNQVKKGQTIQRIFTTVAGIVALLLVSACAQPSQRYASDNKDGVFFTVPYSWHLISQTALTLQEGKSTQTGALDRLAAVKWQVAYSPTSHVTAATILKLTAPSSPIVFVRVRSLLAAEMESVSYSSLRDIIVPLASWIDGSDKTAPLFNVLEDSEEVQKIARGPHTVYTFTQSGKPSQTIDQTALLANDRSTVYILIIRCTTVCFDKNQSLLTKISQSFTVRGNR